MITTIICLVDPVPCFLGSAEDDLLAALRKEREAAARELALISDGIKYARCGMDDAAAVEAGEDGELGALLST